MTDHRNRRTRARLAPYRPFGRFPRLRLFGRRQHAEDDRQHVVLVRSPHTAPDLARAIEYHADWTPFDLVETRCRRSENPASKAAVCVFRYVGPDSDRAHFTRDLCDVLKRIGTVRTLRNPQLQLAE
ncbi:MAG: hypothetical protein AAGA69_06490 [Pseudomonadota bacterium]